MDIELIMVIKSFCIVAGSIEVSFSGKTFICFGCMRHVSHWHMSPTNGLPICGTHVFCPFVGLTCQWDTCFIHLTHEILFLLKEIENVIFSMKILPAEFILYINLNLFRGIVVLFYFVQTYRVPYIQFPNYIQTLVLKIWKLHW